MSFRDKTVINLIPSSEIDDLQDNIIENNEFQAVKSLTIMGANTSGKSNIIKAFTSAIMTIRESEQITLGRPLMRITPFRLIDSSINEPTSFEFVFITNDTKYRYGFSATKAEIIEEYLYTYESENESAIFVRKNNAQLIFTTHDVNVLNTDILRKDQISFVAKDRRNAISDVYLLSDIETTDDNIRNSYMYGRYGAIPNVLRGGLIWE